MIEKNDHTGPVIILRIIVPFLQAYREGTMYVHNGGLPYTFMLKNKINWMGKSKDTDFIEDLKKDPSLKSIIRYDENFNNKRKVLFESSLAATFFNFSHILFPLIHRVSSSLLQDFTELFEKYQNNREDKFLAHSYNFFRNNQDIPVIYNELTNQAIEEKDDNEAHFIEWVKDKLITSDENSALIKLALIRDYGDFFLRTYIHMKKFENIMDIEKIPKGIGDEKNKEVMKKLWNYTRINWPHDPISHSRINISNRKKVNPTTRFGIFSSESSEQKIFHSVHPHLSGGDIWRVTTTSEFTRRARYKLDMPLISGMGGSIALILIPAIAVTKLNPEEIRYFNLAALSFMICLGHHSLHEFHYIWEKLNIPYKEGDYLSIFPDNLTSEYPELNSLCERFNDVVYPNQGTKKNFSKIR